MSDARRPRSIATANVFPLAALLLLLPCCCYAIGGDPDCQPPTAPPYTGYALKSGTKCSGYVYCQNGIATSIMACGDGLLFNGGVGRGGICTWPAQVECADDRDGGGGGGGMSGQVVQAQTQAMITPAPTPRPTRRTPRPTRRTPRPTRRQTVVATTPRPTRSQPAALTPPAPPAGFCGASYAEARSECKQPCQTSNDCCSPNEFCFPTGSSCANVDYGGRGNYYCGASWCDAADFCGIRCPTGTDAECPVGMGCFADVPCRSADGPPAAVGASGGGSGSAGGGDSTILEAFLNAHNDAVDVESNGGGDGNPHNFFCGSSPADAAMGCVPCPSGDMTECGNDFTHGCFKGITACAGRGNGGGGSSNNGSSNNGGSGVSIEDILGNNVNDMVDQYLAGSQGQNRPPTYQTSRPQLDDGSQPTYQTTNQAQQASAAATTTAQSVPAPEPTLPPWTNAPFNPAPTDTNKVVIGYYASWQWYDRNKFADPQNVDFRKYDRINYAFFQPDPLGNLYGTDKWADPQLLWGPYIYNSAEQVMSGPNRNFFCSWDGPSVREHNCNSHDTSKGLIHLAHHAGVEVMPSIGGWTLSDNFPGIAADPNKRENFARQCIKLIEAYGFDGIDLDWEYPGYEDHSGTPEDTVNFTLLLESIRSKLRALGNNRFGRPYGLTAALPCGPDKIDKIQVGRIKDILTELNLMTYDLHGAWDVLTGTNAPMWDQGWGDATRRWSVHGCVNNYVELGVPLSKMNIGLPFYGRSFRGATGMKQFHGGADDINYHLDEGSPQYFNIVNELGRMKTYRHEKTQTQYAVFNRGGGTVSYDDPRAICDKVHYANQRGMHGFLIWEISGDMIDDGNGNIMTPLADAMNNKIQNPRYNCATLRDRVPNLDYRLAPDEPDRVDWSNYDAPAGGTGSANDFNGAQVPAPSPTPPAYITPQNAVYHSSPANVADSPGNSGSAQAGRPSASGGGCPPGQTGYYGTSTCTNYMYCRNGAVVGAKLPCVPGTLFDADIGVCTYLTPKLTDRCGSR